MPSDSDPPVSREAYDEIASGYEVITSAAIREYYEWPAVQSILPDLAGCNVLDAACGDGFYTEQLVERGATVVGVDASSEMISRARERFIDADRVTVEEADLTDGLPSLEDEQFDLVLCQLALEHIED